MPSGWRRDRSAFRIQAEHRRTRRIVSLAAGWIQGDFQRTMREIPEEGGEGGTDLDEGFPFRAGPNAGLPGLALFFSLGRLRILALHESFPRSKRGPSIHGQTLRAEEAFHLLPIGNVLTTGPPISSLPDAPCRRTM